MNLVGKLKDVVVDSKGETTISFVIENYGQRELVKRLKEDKYSININKFKDSRTLEQNRLLWKLIGEIDKAINEIPTPEDDMSIYISALLKAGAKYEYIVAKEETEDMLREQFRAVQFVRPCEEQKGFNVYRVFYGSSKMNKKEFSLLIDAVKQMGYEFGVEMSYWEEMLSNE